MKYDIPDNLTRKQRRSNYRSIVKRAKELKVKWDRLEAWYQTLSEIDILKATNFEHKDPAVNKKFRELAELEKLMVHHVKLANKVKMSKNKQQPIHANTRENASLRAGGKE